MPLSPSCENLQFHERNLSVHTGRGRPKKTWEEVIKVDLRERRVSKDLARDRLAWKSIF